VIVGIVHALKGVARRHGVWHGPPAFQSRRPSGHQAADVHREVADLDLAGAGSQRNQDVQTSAARGLGVRAQLHVIQDLPEY
jgi:hypothetical protein